MFSYLLVVVVGNIHFHLKCAVVLFTQIINHDSTGCNMIIRIIKMSSPNLNNMILLGAVFIYLAVAFGGMDSNWLSKDSIIYTCHVRFAFYNTYDKSLHPLTVKIYHNLVEIFISLSTK